MNPSSFLTAWKQNKPATGLWSAIKCCFLHGSLISGSLYFIFPSVHCTSRSFLNFLVWADHQCMWLNLIINSVSTGKESQNIIFFLWINVCVYVLPTLHFKEHFINNCLVQSTSCQPQRITTKLHFRAHDMLWHVILKYIECCKRCVIKRTITSDVIWSDLHAIRLISPHIWFISFLLSVSRNSRWLLHCPAPAQNYNFVIFHKFA